MKEKKGLMKVGFDLLSESEDGLLYVEAILSAGGHVAACVTHEGLSVCNFDPAPETLLREAFLELATTLPDRELIRPTFDCEIAVCDVVLGPEELDKLPMNTFRDVETVQGKCVPVRFIAVADTPIGEFFTFDK